MNNSIGKFEAIESFIISPDQTYGVIGDLKEGVCNIGDFLQITLNSSISFPAKINEIKKIKLSTFDDEHTLLLVPESVR